MTNSTIRYSRTHKTFKVKALLMLAISGFCWSAAFGQYSNDHKEAYSISAQYNQEFVLDGFVRVREWELQGDKMSLKELGMTNYSAWQLRVEKRLRKNRALSITYDHFLMKGKSTFDRDIIYNGTIIDGRKGIDVSPTCYYRLTATFSGPLLDRPHFEMRYYASLVVDHITFYLDGEVTPASRSTEVFERFGRQAFPFPGVGVESSLELTNKDYINLEVFGSYIPQFKSFYTEDGNIYLQYKNAMAVVNYARRVRRFDLAAGAKLRYLFLFQESREDTNNISTLTFGPYVEVAYHL